MRRSAPQPPAVDFCQQTEERGEERRIEDAKARRTFKEYSNRGHEDGENDLDDVAAEDGSAQ